MTNRQNSDYMSLYLKPFGDQVKAWVANESLIQRSRHPDYSQVVAPLQVHKTTIEPNKPR